MFMVLLTYGNDAQSLSGWGICCMLAPLLRVLRCSVTPYRPEHMWASISILGCPKYMEHVLGSNEPHSGDG